MARLYGLLVGIDTYPNPRHNLKGCINDITEFEAFLNNRANGGDFDTPDLKILTDSGATRADVIAGFQTHLSRAGRGDVALFYYSGHGAQEPAPDLFWGIEPDRLNETLVLYDSRTEGGWDLADKELSRLIAQVAKNGAHVLVVLDCCHSGSGTRAALVDNRLHATAVRRIPTDNRKRPLETYVFGNELAGRDVDLTAEDWALLSSGDHVLLAACQDNQLAKEYVAEGKTFGTFSYFLRQILTESRRSLSYVELIARTRARVESYKADQRPLLEVRGDAAQNQAFLGGSVVARQALVAYFDLNAQAWMLDAGAVHGIPEPEGNETTHLALFHADATAASLRDPDEAEASVFVREVHPERSVLELLPGETLDQDQQFQAVITSLPLPALPVRFEGDDEGSSAARQALAASGLGGTPSLYIREDDANPQYRLLARGGEYLIALTSDDRPLVREIEGGYSEANARRAIANLEHIARWHKIASLANPGSRIEQDAIEMLLDGGPVTDGSITRHYRHEGNTWRNPSFRLSLRNTSSQRLYCALLNLSESFAVGSSLLPGGGVWLEPGQAVDAYEGKPIPTSVPDAFWQRGVTERKDILKLVIGHDAFNAQLMQQDRLEAPRVRFADQDRAVDRGGLRGFNGTLERLMKRVQTREIGDDAEVDAYDDWCAKELVIVTVRPRDEVQVQEADAVPLGFGVTLGAHPTLQATARLTTEVEVGREYTTQGLGALVAPDMFGQEPEVSQPLYFTQARGQDPGLSVLELSGVTNHVAVTADRPLEISLDVELGQDEYLLPVAFDGEFFLPLGRVEPNGARGGAGTRVVIERLPEPEALEERSLTGSIRILFQKFISKVFPAAYEYPLLAVAMPSEDGEASYEAAPDKVEAAVVGAERILLFVHGIIGDTKGMVVSAQRAMTEVAGARVPLKERYDLILAFDYENLDTPIDITAGALAERLGSAGLGAGHGKVLDVVAHSMGGLVSRYYIEKLDGDEVVSHLVMLGTPNAGSPWSTVEDWATAGIAFVLNRVSTVFWPARVLASLTALLERVDATLDQMHPGSEFLKKLAGLPEPSVPYTILAGNTKLITPDPAAHEKRRTRIGKLLAKLHLRQRTYEALTATVFREANDIAAAVSSIKSVRGDPIMREVASDHISYFHSEAGLKALVEALERTME